MAFKVGAAIMGGRKLFNPFVANVSVMEKQLFEL